MTYEEAECLKESQTIELKEGKGGLPLSLWETYSSFCNTSGGTIYLGIKEEKNKPNEVTGIDNPDKLIADFFATLRNKGKVSAAYVNDDDVHILSLNNKRIVSITVPEAPRNAKPVYLNGNLMLSYVRFKDGDHLMDESERRAFLIDNSVESYDLQGNIDLLTFSDVNLDSLHRYRAEMNERNQRNIFKSLSDEEFLNAIGGTVKTASGNSILTNAAVLFFTSYPKIVHLFNYYLLDYRLAKSPSEKWSDRLVSDELTWSGNMFDFYLNVFERLLPYLPRPYRSENGRDIGNSDLQDALKEALANALSNYSLPLADGLLILNEGDRILFRNPGRIKVGLEQAIHGGKSNPRNVGVITLFRLIGVADKAGTGIPKIFQTAKNFSLPTPLLEENACPEETNLTFFLTTLNNADLARGITTAQVIDYLIRKGESGATTKDIMAHFDIKRTLASELLNRLEKEGIIRTNGKPTSGKKYFSK
jgi:ATP-dependent DNA helicase RecG